MRHSLAQLLATPSGSGSPKEPAVAACSFPEMVEESPEEAEPRHEAGFFLDDSGDEELLFPPGLELDDWLEAAMAEESRESGGGEGRESQAPKASSRPRRPGNGGSNRLKAAAAARLNRQKKKQYVLGLETRLQSLAAENRHLRDRNRGLCRRLRDLERETGYLRAVLANQSAVGRLLSRLAGDGARRVGLRIRSSLLEEEEEGEEEEGMETRPSWESSDHDYALPVPEEEEEEEKMMMTMEDKRRRAASLVPASSPGGICLHVDQDQVSVEFCSVCARRAAGSSFAATSAAPAAAASSSSSFASKIFSFRCLPCQAPLCRG